jgi:hypothetical protein
MTILASQKSATRLTVSINVLVVSTLYGLKVGAMIWGFLVPITGYRLPNEVNATHLE